MRELSVPVCARTRAVVVSLVLVLLAGVVLVPTSAWSQRGLAGSPQRDLTIPRWGHTANVLPDGTVLVVGGVTASGATDETEIILPGGSVFHGPRAIYGRAGHTASDLGGGRILIAGGHDDALSLDSTEIYDAGLGAFMLGPKMTSPRTGHSVVALENGDLALIGGDASGSIEIFQARNEAFRATAVVMASPRQNHASITLKDGRVLTVGGTDADGKTLKTAEIFDPKSGKSYEIGDMKSPRKTPNLRLLVDGKVQVIGGNNGNPTLEMFNAAGYFTAEVNLPKKLLKGNSGAATDSLACDDCSEVETTGGQTLQIGGKSSKGEALGGVIALEETAEAWVTTDKTDYPPGEVVTITGGGYLPGETINISITRSPETSEERQMTFTSVADADGKFVNTDFVTLQEDLFASFLVVATGATSNRSAFTAFTDGHTVTSVTPNSGPTTGGTSVTISGSGFGNSGDVFAVTFGGVAATGVTRNSANSISAVTPARAAGTVDVIVSISETKQGVTTTHSKTLVNGYTYTSANTAPTISDVANQSINEDTSTGALAFTVGDAETAASSLTVSRSSSNTTLVPNANIVFGGSGASRNVTVTPAANQSGTATITITVTDAGGLTASDTFLLTVNAVNDAPVLTNPGNQSINEGSLLTIALSATDVDSTNLVYSITSGSESGMALNGSTGAFTWTPSEAQGPGSYPVTFRVTDDGAPALVHQVSVTITVSEVNVAPELASIGNKSVDELAPLSFAISATDSDLPANTLVYAMTSGPDGATFDPGTKTFHWTPTEAQGPGSYNATFQVTDGTAADSETISITVNEVNAAPSLTGVPASATIDEMAPYGFDAGANDSDIPSQTLTFSLVGAPAGASIDASTGVFSWTPGEAQGPGPYTFTVRVSDGVTQTDASVTLTVNEVNLAPELAAIGGKSVNEQTLLSFAISATDPDIPANTLVYSMTSGPAGATFDPATKTFSWTPSEADGPGLYSATFQVGDGTATDSETISIEVKEVNVVPTVTGVPPSATIAEMAAHGFDAGATDPDVPVQPLAFSLVGAPAGASIDASTGVFAWTPGEAQGPGSYTFAVRVTDGVANTDASITITVEEVNLAPELAAIGNKSVDELSPLSFTISATDPDLPANTLTYAMTAGPSGATFHAATRTFDWTPTENQGPGSYTATFEVSDGTAADSETISIEVKEVNAAPVLSNVPPSATIDEMASYTFDADASDADVPSQTLTFSLSGQPSGASIDSATGVFTWTPSEAQGPGVYNFTVRVSDGVTNTDASVTLTVAEVNLQPNLASPGDKSVDELTLLTFTAVATDPDLPANSLTYAIQSGAVAGMSIDPSTGVFTWTPSESQGPGSYPVTLRVTDGGTPALHDDETITITVKEVNVAPVLSNVPSSANIDEMVAYSFDANAADADIPVQTLSFSMIGAPAGASIDPSTGVFNWTPGESQGPAEYSFTVRVTDGVVNTDSSVTLVVKEVNVKPDLASPGDKSLDELTPLTFTAAATDPDLPANTLSYSISGGSLAGMSIDASNGVFTWTPTEGQGPGVYSVTLRATDNGVPALHDEETIKITVNEVNVAPVLSGVPSAPSIDEMVPYTFDANAADADIPVQTLTFSMIGAPAGASIDPSTGVFNWTPTEADGPGSYSFTVRVTDSVVNTDASVTLTVKEVNVKPNLTSPGDKNVDELTPLTFTASATDSDVPSNTLTYSIASGGVSGMSIDASTGVFTWTPTEAQGPGEYTITLRATDNGSPVLFDEKAIKIAVNEVNVAPVLTDVPASAAIDEMVAYTFDANAADADIPVQTLTFSLIGAPAGSSIDPSTGVFTWTPSEAQGPGVVSFTVRLSDTVTHTDASVTLTVKEVNVKPNLASPGDKTVDELTALAFTASATDSDVPSNTLTYSIATGAVAGMSINSSSGAFAWTPTEAQGPGEYTITLRATDNGTPVLYDEKTITITVKEVNVAPVVSNVPASVTIDEMVPYTFDADASDVDIPVQTLTFSLVSGPDGASIHPATGVFTWTPGEAQGPGSYTFQVRVSDGVTTTDASVTLTVNEVNTAPVLAAIGNKSVPWEKPLTFTASANDTDLPANTLTFTLAPGAPAGATINSSNGAFSWTPTSAQVGNHSVTIVVTDNGVPAMADSETITISVLKHGTTLTYTGATSGQYSDPVTLSATLMDVVTGTPVPSKAISFTLGAQAASGTTDTAGVASSSLTLLQAPNPYTVVSSFAGDGLYVASGDSDPFTILKEDARAYYTGALFASTGSSNSSTATVTLSATIKDITAVDPGSDPNGGDISKATVTFVNRDAGDAVLCTAAVGLVTTSDTKTGTATCNWTANIGNANAVSYTVGIVVNGYYTRNSTSEDTVVSVAKAMNDFITGGGYLVLQRSSGERAGDAGTKGNFGFNVKYNKAGTNLQGNINAIIRRTEGGSLRVYQIKGNSMTSLAVRSNLATFNGKANIQDITNPLAPVSVDGNATLQVTMTDNGEPGSSDTIGITVWNKQGGLWFSSNWDGTRTSEQTLGGGNLQVR